MAEPESDLGAAASGVQNLIDRIRDSGVEAGREEAAKIVREAEEKAAAVVADATAKADTLLNDARKKITAEQNSAEASLKLAARDTIQELSANVRAAFERQLKRFVSAQLDERDFLREIILALASKTAAETTENRAVEILLSESMDVDGKVAPADGEDAEAEERIRRFVLGLSSETLREGIEFKLDPNVEHGVSVQIVGEELRIDLNENTISEFLVRHLLPRYRRILASGSDAPPAAGN